MTMSDVKKPFQVWWVNQGHTYAKAKTDGYLWAPMPVEGGQSFPHWESMTQVEAGDLVINYGHKCIVAMSIAKSKAISHKNKKKDGWRIDLEYHDLDETIDLEEIKPFIDEIRDSIETNAPFDNFRNPQQGYLFHFSMEGLSILNRLFFDRFPGRISEYLGMGPDGTFERFCLERGFLFDADLVKRFVLSLKTSPFVILCGRPGSGKTKLAQLYAQYLDEKERQKPASQSKNTLAKRRWYKLSYNDKTIVEAFEGADKKINLVRKTILKDGIMSLLGLDSKKQIDMNQKKMMKDLQEGDVIIAYQGGYTLGGIGVVSQPHFFDNAGDAYDSFFESTKNFIRIDWKFKGPMKINDFFLDDDKIPAFSMWGDTIHELDQDQIRKFMEYLASKDIHFEADEIYEQARTYAMIPVGHGWEDKASLLGHFDPSIDDYRSTKALDLIMNADIALKKGVDSPFFLILDGMNTSKVDRYMADVLSAMESHEPIVLHASDEVEQYSGIPKELALPPNICIVGTVYDRPEKSGLSPAVLDRANVIELPTPPGIRMPLLQTGQLSLNIEPGIKPLFPMNPLTLNDMHAYMAEVQIIDEELMGIFQGIEKEIEKIQQVLNQLGCELGFRAMKDILVYLYFAWEADRKPDHWSGWADALDAQILQKVLPKIRGSEKRVRHHLMALYGCCFSHMNEDQKMSIAMGDKVDLGDARFPRSARKLQDMQIELETRGFVSFLP